MKKNFSPKKKIFKNYKNYVFKLWFIFKVNNTTINIILTK